MKTTLILGASTKVDRYAYIAAGMLIDKGHSIVPVGLRKGEIYGQRIRIIGDPVPEEIHTITLYVGPHNQPAWYDYILAIQPKRLIFNPGTENPELVKIAMKAGIEPESACTLVLLSTNAY